MSGLFNSYETDYEESVERLSSTVAHVKESIAKQKAHDADPTVDYYPPPTTGPSSRSQLLHEAMQTLAHIKDVVASMGYEANDLTDTAQRNDARATVNGCRRAILALDSEVAALRAAVTQAERADLLSFGGGGAAGGGDGPGVREEADEETKALRLTALQTSEKMQGGTNTLLKAERYLAQSNEMGRASLGTLRQQTEQIQHIRDTTADVDGEISASRQVIQRMQRTALKHKLWLWGIIIALFLFMCLMFYLR